MTTTTTKPTLKQAIGNAILTALESPAAATTLADFIENEEGAAEQAIETLIQEAPTPGGALAFVVPIIKTEAEDEIKTLATAYTPAEIAAELLTLGENEAKDIFGVT